MPTVGLPVAPVLLITEGICREDLANLRTLILSCNPELLLARTSPEEPAHEWSSRGRGLRILILCSLKPMPSELAYIAAESDARKPEFLLFSDIRVE